MNKKQSRKIFIVAEPAFKNFAKNPYNSLLYNAILKDWSRIFEIKEYAFLYKLRPGAILHLHWPDGFCNHPNSLRALIRTLLLLLECMLYKLFGGKVLWTAHNIHSHEIVHPKTNRLFWKYFLMIIDGFIMLSESSRFELENAYPILKNIPSAVIPHGHYKSILRHKMDRKMAKKKLGFDTNRQVVTFFGAIREYKNIDILINIFSGPICNKCDLLIAGQPDGSSSVQKSIDRAKELAGITLRLGLIKDEELQTIIEASDLIVLPYKSILNSGSLLYALSCNRCVLVPNTPTFREIYNEIGQNGICFYEKQVTESDIIKALEEKSNTHNSFNLSKYNWEGIAQSHATFFSKLVCTESMFKNTFYV